MPVENRPTYQDLRDEIERLKHQVAALRGRKCPLCGKHPPVVWPRRTENPYIFQTVILCCYFDREGGRAAAEKPRQPGLQAAGAASSRSLFVQETQRAFCEWARAVMEEGETKNVRAGT